jgi:hypothetical protein
MLCTLATAAQSSKKSNIIRASRVNVGFFMSFSFSAFVPLQRKKFRSVSKKMVPPS